MPDSTQPQHFVSLSDAAGQLQRLVDHVQHGGEPIRVTDGDRTVAVLVSEEDALTLQQHKEARYQAFAAALDEAIAQADRGELMDGETFAAEMKAFLEDDQNFR